jgi:hypothetical protein
MHILHVDCLMTIIKRIVFPEYLSIVVLHLSNYVRNMVYFVMWIMTSDFLAIYLWSVVIT